MCGLYFKRITNSHLNKQHNITSPEFKTRYPNADRGIIPWNKDKNKHTHLSLKKLSQTLKRQNRWNFSEWQIKNKIRLKALREKEFSKNSNLAEFVGILLGDGNLTRYSRTEAVRIVCNLSKRLNLPCSNKIKNKVSVPCWIKKSKRYSIDCLRGLNTPRSWVKAMSA